jgi:para-aminobenzoate synthetase component I
MPIESFRFRPELKKKILHWVATFPHAVFLDSCAQRLDEFGQYDFIAGARKNSAEGIASTLDEWQTLCKTPGWKFGVIGYEVKNKVEPILKTTQSAFIPTSELYFFLAEVVISRKKDADEITIEAENPSAVFAAIQSIIPTDSQVVNFEGFIPDFSHEEYLQTVAQLREHIRNGDCYEINFCRHFGAKGLLTNPAGAFSRLTGLSPVPFAGFLRRDNWYLLSASPERFLQHHEGRLVTQPIKGTAPRGNTPEQDVNLAQQLRDSQKEQSENVMIVDLCRNDLYRSCVPESVKVLRLFEVQPFAQVHQLVSTVTGQLKPEVNPIQALLSAFPPGSMTGAPKVRVCQLADQYERTQRGVYSGALGYVAPSGDFDFNVVIRTLIHDQKTKSLSFHTGGAITWQSEAEKEWEETLVKASALIQLISEMC